MNFSLRVENKVKEAPVTPEEINDLIIDAVQDIKAKDVVKLDLRKLDDAPTDFFIVCTGESNVQVRSIANNVHARLKKELGTLPKNLEGTAESRWVLVDYFWTVVHVFHPESREFYELEELWSDAIVTKYEDVV